MSGTAKARTIKPMIIGGISAAAGLLALSTTIGAELWGSFKLAIDTNNGHPMTDTFTLFAPALSFAIALVAIVVGVLAIGLARGPQVLAIVGVSVAVTVLIFISAGFASDFIYSSAINVQDVL